MQRSKTCTEMLSNGVLQMDHRLTVDHGMKKLKLKKSENQHSLVGFICVVVVVVDVVVVVVVVVIVVVVVSEIKQTFFGGLKKGKYCHRQNVTSYMFDFFNPIEWGGLET